MEDGRRSWRLTALRYKAFSLSPNCAMNIYSTILVCRKLSTTILISGATKIHTTFQEGELGLIHKRLSCRATGTHPSPRSASVWSSATRWDSLPSTGTPTPCTRWSLTANTAPPHLVVARGSRWLVHRPPYSPTVTRKGLMLSASIHNILKQELVSPVIMRTIVSIVTPESDLVQEDIMTTLTRVEMRLQHGYQTTEISTSRPWATSWFSSKEPELFHEN